MAVSQNAAASGRNFCSAALTTTLSTVLYTAPALNANVTTPSSTAYVKEIVVANTTAATINVTKGVNGRAIMGAIPVAPYDTKILRGLNTMLDAGATITGGASAVGVNAVVSGVEVQ
jgi:hypothetical protein